MSPRKSSTYPFRRNGTSGKNHGTRSFTASSADRESDLAGREGNLSLRGPAGHEQNRDRSRGHTEVRRGRQERSDLMAEAKAQDAVHAEGRAARHQVRLQEGNRSPA